MSYQIATCSIHFGGVGDVPSIKHNENRGGMRDRETRDSGHYIDHERTADNVVLKAWQGGSWRQGVLAMPYDDSRTIGEMLEDVLDRYNSGKRPSRQLTVGDLFDRNRKQYIQHREVIMQVGNADNPVREEDAVELLTRAYEDFQDRCPWAHITSAVIHLDETSPHLHIAYVPLAERGAERGLPLATSLDACLGGGRERFETLRSALEKDITVNAFERDIMICNPRTGRTHDSYKVYHEREEMLQEVAERTAEAERLMQDAQRMAREAQQILERAERGATTERDRDSLENLLGDLFD